MEHYVCHALLLIIYYLSVQQWGHGDDSWHQEPTSRPHQVCTDSISLAALTAALTCGHAPAFTRLPVRPCNPVGYIHKQSNSSHCDAFIAVPVLTIAILLQFGT